MPKKGYKQSEKHKQNLKANHKGFLGKHHSDETKELNRQASTGRVHSVESRKKQSEAKLGEKNNFWIDGRSPENRRIKRSIEWRLWRESVYARDNWTCQKCGEKGNYLHPHHIKNFSSYPELRFAIDNGITFCKDCHIAFHRIYGNKNNTKEQLKEFINKDGTVVDFDEKEFVKTIPTE